MSGRTKDTPSATSRLRKVLEESPFFCKVLELILCIVSVGLLVDPYNLSMNIDMNHAAIVYVSICGFILINSIIILCYLLGERQPKKMSMIFSIAGAILCCAAGGVLIRDWKNLQKQMMLRYSEQYSNQMIASGVFSLIAALVFAIDTFLTNKYE